MWKESKLVRVTHPLEGAENCSCQHYSHGHWDLVSGCAGRHCHNQVKFVVVGSQCLGKDGTQTKGGKRDTASKYGDR